MPKKTKRLSEIPRTRNKTVKPPGRVKDKPFQESNQLDKQIIENVREGIILYDRQLRYLVWNPYMEELTGLRAEAVLGKRPRDLPSIYLEQNGKLQMERKAVEGIEACIEKALSGDTFAYMDIPIFIKETGVTGWTSARYGPFRNAKGEIIGVLATVHDTTDRRKTEEELRKSERQLADAQQIAHVGSWNWDILSNVVSWSDELFRIFGLKPKERIVNFETFLNFVHPEDRSHVSRYVQQAMEDHKPFRFDYRIVWKNQTIHVIHCDGEVILDEAGRPIRMHGTAQDITDRKLGEEQLRRSEEELRKILTNIDEIIYSVVVKDDPMMSTFQFMSPRTEDIVGYRPEEFIEDQGLWFRILHPEDVPIVTESTRKILERGSTGVREYRLLHKDTGEYRWVEDKVVPQVGDTGKVIGFFGVARDITDRKRAEEALRESSEFNQQIITNAQEGIIVYDRNLRYRLWNRFMENMTGKPAREVLGKHPMEVFPFLKEHGVISMLERALSGKTVSSPDISNYEPGAGKTLWLTGKASPLRDARGAIAGVIVVVNDITDRRRAEEAVRESEERFRASFKNAAVGMGLVDRTGRFVETNRALSQITGYSEEELKGLTFTDITHPDDRTNNNALYQTVIDGTRDGFVMEKRYVRKDGAIVWITLSVGVIRDRQGNITHTIGLIEDITERKRAEAALQESQRALSTLMSNLPGMVYRCKNDKDWTVEFISEGSYRLTGYRPSDLVDNRNVSYGRHIIHPDDQKAVLADVQAALGRKQPFQLMYRIIAANGSEKWVWEQGRGIFSSKGDLQALEGFVVDITERRRADEALRSSEARNRALINAMPDMMFRISREGVLLEFIPSKDPEPVLPEGKFLGKNIKSLLPADVARQALHHVRQALDSGDKQVFEFPFLAMTQLRGYEARIVKSGPNDVLAIVRDITDRQAQAAALEYQALHDTLTDLPNRTLVLDRLRQAILAAERENKPLALLLMDLDRFKEVNDALGHHHGDLLLKLVGPRVLSVLRESDTIARLGGDEFAILLPATDMDGATVAAQKILDALTRSFVVEGFFLDIGASIGIALFPEHGEDVDMLMRRADVAMYQAKQSGSGYAVYILEHDRHSPSRLTLMGELRHAVERKELILHYQPKIDLKSGRTIGVEALVRWQHPHQGLIHPDQFISLAEHIGVIKPLTLWVLAEATRQGVAWRRAGLEITIAVNLSVRNLHDLHLPDWIAELLAASHLPPEGLNLEITESAIMADPARAMEILTRLRGMGIRLSIDDFGAGYSSLSYLKKLPVTEVKVDKSFIIGMSGNTDDAVIVRSTIDLAHNLGLKVAAEGVESQAVLDRLIAMGCDEAQGYFISQPIPALELTRWLNDSPCGMKRPG